MVSIYRSSAFNDRTCPDLSDSLLLDFLQLASQLPGRGPVAAAVLLVRQCHRLGRTKHLLVTPNLAKQYQLTPTTCYRSLALLESARLISVARKRGKAPLVTLLGV